MSDLRLHPLTETLCDILGSNLREADRIDCIAHDADGVGALRDGMIAGPSAAVFEGTTAIGAMGWTYEGAIWSLWRDLSRPQSRKLMEATPRVILAMAKEARRPLSNVVWEGNRLTLAWLRASHCFTFLDTSFEYRDKRFLPFFVKPLGELLHV